MKKRKGFTLIELLAVIVILAVIALIATPIIIGVIDEARKKAFENTAYGVLEGLRLNYTERIMTGTTSEEQNFTFPNSGLKLSGEEPAYGEAKIDSKGNISFALADKDKKWCAKKDGTSEKVIMEDYTEENCKIDGTSGGGEVAEAIPDGIGIFFDPVSGTQCDTYTEANSMNETKTGCLKFYTFGGNNSNSKINLILDHNTSYSVLWNSSGNANDSSEIDGKVASDTAGWTGNPRLISAQEVAEITGNSKFTGKREDFFLLEDLTQPDSSFVMDCMYAGSCRFSTGEAKYKWLFDRTKDCTKFGCDVSDANTDKIWTSTKAADEDSIWVIQSYGMMGLNGASDNFSPVGIRPVITVSKSLIK